MTILIKVTDNRKELMLHFGDARIVDFVIGKELEACKQPVNGDVLLTHGIHLSDHYKPTVWLSPHLFEIA